MQKRIYLYDILKYITDGSFSMCKIHMNVAYCVLNTPNLSFELSVSSITSILCHAIFYIWYYFSFDLSCYNPTGVLPHERGLV
jgi:hypothetical protein